MTGAPKVMWYETPQGAARLDAIDPPCGHPEHVGQKNLDGKPFVSRRALHRDVIAGGTHDWQPKHTKEATR